MIFFEKLVRIDELMSLEPTRMNVETLMTYVRSDVRLHEYFYGHLRSPDWAPQLYEMDAFTTSVDNGNAHCDQSGIAHHWPQGHYLARMSDSRQEDFLQVLSDVMDEQRMSPSFIVHYHLTKAALLLPIYLADQWAAAEAIFVANIESVADHLAELHGQLVKRLIENGYSKSGEYLLSVLLEIFPNPTRAKTEDLNEYIVKQLTVEPSTRVNKHCYEQLLKEVIPACITHDPSGMFDMLSVLIDSLIMHYRNVPDSEKPNDSLHLHRPAIEDHEQNMDFYFENPLITKWRNAAEHVVRETPTNISLLVEQLEHREWNIYRRLALHLLRIADPPPIDYIESRLTDVTLFDNIGLHHEFWNLLHDRYSVLSPAGKKTVLNHVDQSRSIYDRMDVSEDKRNIRRRYDQYRWLLALEGMLPAEWTSRLESFREEFGQPSMPPDFLSWTGKAQSVSTKSPVSQEDLSSKSIPELLDYIKTWRPTGNHHAPSPAGLGAELSALVQAAPEKWAEELKHFQDPDLDPTYQRFLISGYQSLVQSGKSIPWEPVLTFFKWVVDQDPVIPGRELPDQSVDGFVADRTRMQSRMEIARLLDKALPAKEEANPPISLRKQIWQIIEPLTSDANPSLEDEARDISGGTSDALSRSLNTVRGEALHAMMQYALWVYRALEDERKGKNDLSPITFNDIPRVREVFERRFSNDSDHWYANSTTDRAVLGRWIPQLVYLDSGWVRAHLSDLYPDKDDAKHLKSAFWDTYVCYGRLFGNVYDALQDIYLKAVHSLGEHLSDKNGESPAVRLAEQVMILYMWSKVDLTKADLVHKFFKFAHPDVTGKAIAFVGNTLEDNKNEITDQIIQRLRDLWDWRVDLAGGIDHVPIQERNAFCFWFAVGRFDLDWSMPYLKAGLKEWHGLRWGEDRVLHRLARVFKHVPLDALECLRLMVERTDSTWFFAPSEGKPTWQILDQGLGHADPAVRDEADSIINLLGSIGHIGYRPLWKKHRKK